VFITNQIPFFGDFKVFYLIGELPPLDGDPDGELPPLIGEFSLNSLPTNVF
jgi:hypothetical protein